ncbi:MAG TPA: hypothetical protein DEB40_12060 [Elusimicrobia bacterium]|nr:hypothetical protein [Elusimicrobiota bacterium]HBT62468.1 hypothetical protein [Elusimicrobiota bacterium]
MEKLRRAESFLLAAESAILVAILIFMIVMSFVQVMLRQFFGGGTLWGDTLLRHLVLWLGFLGAALASAEEKHFAFEALSERLPPRVHGAAAFLSRLGAAVVALLLARASWAFLLDEKAAGNELFTLGPMAVAGWPFAIILPAGFLLVALHALLRMFGPAPGAGKSP